MPEIIEKPHRPQWAWLIAGLLVFATMMALGEFFATGESRRRMTVAAFICLALFAGRFAQSRR